MQNSNTNIFILEGGNATGKTSLLETLKDTYDNSQSLYSLDESFEKLRENAYTTWSDLTSLYFYIAGSVETLSKVDSKLTFLDRSIISTFAMYLSRVDETEWKNYKTMFINLFEQLPKINTIIYLKTSEKVRKERIENKTGNAKASDLKELEWENKKTRAREFLLDLLRLNNVKIHEIDTSELEVSELREKAIKIINKEYPPVLNIMLGLPGCGKSNYCKNNFPTNSDYKILSTDEIREKHYPNEDFSPELKEGVFLLLMEESLQQLTHGYKVILDTTFLNIFSYRKRLTEYLSQHLECVNINIISFSLDVKQSIKNDKHRPSSRFIGEEIIQKLAKEYDDISQDEIYNSIINVKTFKK